MTTVPVKLMIKYITITASAAMNYSLGVTRKRTVAEEPPLPASDTTISLSPVLRDDTAIDSGNTAVKRKCVQ